jgi:hypothetical protein
MATKSKTSKTSAAALKAWATRRKLAKAADDKKGGRAKSRKKAA